MAWNQMLTNLRDVLADLYYTQELARRVVEAAGLKPGFIDLEGDSITRWHNILREADRRNKVAAVVQVAHDEYRENDWLTAAVKGDLWVVSGADINKVAWQGETGGDPLEKIMGDKSTLMPIHFPGGRAGTRQVGRQGGDAVGWQRLRLSAAGQSACHQPSRAGDGGDGAHRHHPLQLPANERWAGC
jgi:hypothetical protein